MKKKSRLLSLILSLAMVFTLTATPVFAFTGNAAVEGSEASDDSSETTEIYSTTGNVATVSSGSGPVVNYDTLEGAFAVATSGETITLTSDATVSELIEIKSSQNITLDLAGYTISGNMSSRMFAVSGTLTITGSGTIENTGSSNAISNGGTLIIESEPLQLIPRMRYITPER